MSARGSVTDPRAAARYVTHICCPRHAPSITTFVSHGRGRERAGGVGSVSSSRGSGGAARDRDERAREQYMRLHVIGIEGA
eukprot:3765357-Prymnesium_polylepis.1